MFLMGDLTSFCLLRRKLFPVNNFSLITVISAENHSSTINGFCRVRAPLISNLIALFTILSHFTFILINYFIFNFSGNLPPHESGMLEHIPNTVVTTGDRIYGPIHDDVADEGDVSDDGGVADDEEESEVCFWIGYLSHYLFNLYLMLPSKNLIKLHHFKLSASFVN
jgi:hypothetical protein